MPGAAKEAEWFSRVERVVDGLAPNYVLADTAKIALSSWFDLLVRWNQRINLTAARSADDIVDLFLADAVVLHQARCEVGLTNTWLDVGSGAGAPGIAMALLDPSMSIQLVEPNVKRVAFLRQVIGRLRLQNVSVHRARMEDLEPSIFDDAVSRATLAPDAWLERGLKLARQRTWVLLACSDWMPSSARATIVYDRGYRWPLTGAHRRVLGLSASTPRSDV